MIEIKSNTSSIHLAIAFDENYLHAFYALLNSILENHHAGQIFIHVIATGISEGDQSLIKSFALQKQCTIKYYSIDKSLVSQFVLLNNWTHAVYYRLLFPLLVDNSIERLLYLDTDTVVIQNLEELYKQDLEVYPLGAVYDNYIKTQPLLGIHEEGEYLNSGVLLIDLVKWREQQVSEAAINYLNKYPQNILFVDQCALNAVLKKNWKKLPSKYNVMYSSIPTNYSMKQLKAFLKDQFVVHFTLQRPWNMLCRNRLAFLYHSNLRKTPIGRNAKMYADFSWRKVPAFLKIRVQNIYFDLPFIPQFWRIIKKPF